MNPRQLRSLGILLGVVVLIVLVLQFTHLYKSGDTNWYYLVMMFGMLLLLYYSFRGRSRY